MPPSTRNVLVVAAVSLCLLGMAATTAAAVGGPSLLADTSDDAGSADALTAEPREPVSESGLGLPARLTLGPDASEARATVEPDASAALDSGGTELEGRFAELSLENRIDDAESDADARSVLRDGVSKLDRSITALSEREQAAIRDYRAGAITAEEFLLELRKIHDRAVAHQRSIAVLDERAEEVPAISLDADLNRLRGESFLHYGPVRDDVSAAATAQRAPQDTYVRANEAGIVLATIEGDQYHRETTRADNFEFEDVEPDPDLSRERAEEMYQWLGGFRATFASADRTSDEMTDSHDYGEISVHFDIRTEQVFREEQTLNLQRLADDRLRDDEELPPMVEGANVTGNDYRLAVNRTYRTGPAQVTVEELVRDDNGTIVGGEPVDVPVELNGDLAGTTGENGELWTILPYEDARIEATIGDETLVANVTWDD